jgi:hypothetical protein
MVFIPQLQLEIEHFHAAVTCGFLSNIFLSRLSPYIMKLLGVINVGFDITDQALIRFSAFARD